MGEPQLWLDKATEKLFPAIESLSIPNCADRTIRKIFARWCDDDLEATWSLKRV